MLFCSPHELHYVTFTFLRAAVNCAILTKYSCEQLQNVFTNVRKPNDFAELHTHGTFVTIPRTNP